MLISLTVGKVDAGLAVLLTEDKRLIEFPSILLPPDITSGSVVDVNVSRNLSAESQATKSFRNLQSSILSTFGTESPASPVLRCRNATQTSVVLEWDSISLATANLRSLSLYRNGSKAGSIPRPLEMTSTKISGLAVDTEYMFYLVLRTSAGTYSSQKLTVRTHKMTDLSGITVTPGVMAPPLRESLQRTVERIGAKFVEQLRIDTTHFVCTEGRGAAWERAVEMNVPVVLPDWIKGCEREGRIVGVRGYYLNADPKLRQVGPGAGLSRGASTQSIQTPEQTPRLRQSENEQNASRQQTTPRTEVTPPTPDRRHAEREDEPEDSDDEGGSIVPPTPPMQNESPLPIRDSAPQHDEERSDVESSDEGEQANTDRLNYGVLRVAQSSDQGSNNSEESTESVVTSAKQDKSTENFDEVAI